jgi:hypothetical protein
MLQPHVDVKHPIGWWSLLLRGDFFWFWHPAELRLKWIKDEETINP